MKPRPVTSVVLDIVEAALQSIGRDNREWHTTGVNVSRITDLKLSKLSRPALAIDTMVECESTPAGGGNVYRHTMSFTVYGLADAPGSGSSPDESIFKLVQDVQDALGSAFRENVGDVESAIIGGSIFLDGWGVAFEQRLLRREAFVEFRLRATWDERPNADPI